MEGGVSEEDYEGVRFRPGYSFYLIRGEIKFITKEVAEGERERGRKQGFLVIMLDESAVSEMHLP